MHLSKMKVAERPPMHANACYNVGQYLLNLVTFWPIFTYLFRKIFVFYPELSIIYLIFDKVVLSCIFFGEI